MKFGIWLYIVSCVVLGYIAGLVMSSKTWGGWIGAGIIAAFFLPYTIGEVLDFLQSRRK